MERYKKLSNFLNLYFTYLHSWMYLDGMQGDPAALDSPLHVLPLAGEVVDVAGKNHLGHLVSAERVFNHLNLTFQFKDLCKCACWHSSGIFMAKQKGISGIWKISGRNICWRTDIYTFLSWLWWLESPDRHVPATVWPYLRRNLWSAGTSACGGGRDSRSRPPWRPSRRSDHLPGSRSLALSRSIVSLIEGQREKNLVIFYSIEVCV